MGGVLPLVWTRNYSTALLDTPRTALGPGWTTPYFACLTRQGSDFELVLPEGGVQVFSDAADALMRGEVIRDLGSFQELAWMGDRYVLTRWDVVTGKVARLVFLATLDSPEWPLTAIEDASGRALELHRDTKGQLRKVQQRLEKRALVLDYDNAGHIVRVSLHTPDKVQQELVRYEYDERGTLSAVTDALGSTDRYEYDENYRLTREVLKDGGVYDFRYDHKGRCTRTFGLARYDEKVLTYRDASRWTQVTDSLGNVSHYHWLPTGQVLRIITPIGAIHETEYDTYGRIVAKTDPNGGRTSFEYDDNGNRTRITRPLGHETVLAFNDHHQWVTLRDPDGHVWKREFDAYNRLVASEDPLGGQWTYTRDHNGRVIHVTNPKDAHREFNYGENGELFAETDWEGHVTRYVTDHFGRFVERHDAMGGVTRMTFDALGRHLGTQYPDGSRTTNAHDPAGNVVRTTDANGNVSTFRYGTCRRLHERQDPLGRKVVYNWSSEPHRLDSIINENGEEYRFFRDAAGRVVREKGFDGRELSFEYDLVGNCVASVNGIGEQTRYIVDQLGRLTKKLLPDGTAEEWEYDLRGNPIRAVNACAEVSFERDALGRVVREQQDGYVIEREWDATGNEIKMQTDAGLEVHYSRDRNGALSEVDVAGHTLAFRRDALGLETSRLLPGGVCLRQQYDSMAQLKEQWVDSDVIVNIESFVGPASQDRLTTAIRRTYRHDAAGNVTSVADGQRVHVVYIYDPTERLLQVESNGEVTEVYGYDATGNISMIQSRGSIELLQYAPGNRLIRQGAATFEYDDHGRRIRRTDAADTDRLEWQYHWDAQDQLVKIEHPGGSVWTYTYDAFGRRLRKRGPNVDVRYVWDQDVIVHEIHEDLLKSTWIYDKDSKTPIFTLQKGSAVSIICDHLGTPKELLDGRGRLVWAIEQRTWGGVDPVIGSRFDCPLRWKGQWFDPESGLHYSRFRYYDPATARFMTPDPIGLRGSLNIYRYVKNPVNWVDPFGLADTPPCGDDDDPELAERARRDAERDMREADRGLDAHDKEFYGGDGTIYLVPGSGTPSKLPYVGSADDLEARAAGATDGRDRSQAVPIGAYPIGDRDARRQAEQQGIDDMGGIDNLDNKRNEIRKK